MHPFRFESIPAGAGCAVLRAEGEIDAYAAPQLRDLVADLAVSGTVHLIADLRGASFVDSAGLGALIGGIRRTRELGGDVAVACNRPTLVRLLKTTGFDRIVTVAETIEEAAASLEKSVTVEE